MKQMTSILKTQRTSAFNTGLAGKIAQQGNWLQKKNGITLKFQCGFRKNFGSQRCFLVMLETCKEAINSNKDFGALLTNLL